MDAGELDLPVWCGQEVSRLATIYDMARKMIESDPAEYRRWLEEQTARQAAMQQAEDKAEDKPEYTRFLDGLLGWLFVGTRRSQGNAR